VNADVATLPAVKMDARLVKRIGVREWGMPSLCMPGKIWRSVERGTITCMLPHEDATKVKIETLPLVVIPAGEFSVLPDSWRSALWEYMQAWPDTAEQPAHAGGQGKTVEAMLQNAGITLPPGVGRLLAALDTTLPPIKAPLTFNTARVLRCTACNYHWPKDGIELVYTHTDVNDVPGPDSLIMCPNCLASEADGKPCVVPHR